MNSVKLNKTSKTSKSHVLTLNLTDKIDLRRGEKSVALSNLSIYYTWKIIKNHTKTINLKYQLQDKNGTNVPHLKITEVVLVHCNIVNNDYQQDSKVLYTFVPNKQFVSLLEDSPTNSIFLKTFNSEFSYIRVWFTDATE